jgi:hypothetical protein
MKTFLALACLAGCFYLTPARAATIYSTLGSTAPAWDTSNAETLLGPSVEPAIGYVEIAVPFVPSASYEVTFIDLPLFYEAGINSATVALQADASGVPGAVLGSWVVSPTPFAHAEVTISASGTVTAGQQYWISVLPNGGDTEMAWAYNNQGITGDFARIQNGTVSVFHGLPWLPAMDVLGDPVPEPSTFALGLAAAALLVRRAFRR